MKSFLGIFIVVLLWTGRLTAQSAEKELPPSTLIPHYRLSVSYNTTTVLVFSAAVRPVDRGDRDILAVKQPGVDNVLKIKAGRRNFPPTNLHVFTADGRIYAFDITYTDSLASSRDLTEIMPTRDSSCIAPVAILTGQPMNEASLVRAIAAMHHLPQHRTIARAHHARMTLVLEHIRQTGNLFFLRLRLTNRSNLSYPVSFVRCYIRDQQKAHRTSSQEQELLPAYQDSLVLLTGHADQRWVLALPVFTLANGKEFVMEVHEQHGGRSIILHLHNRTLLQASPL